MLAARIIAMLVTFFMIGLAFFPNSRIAISISKRRALQIVLVSMVVFFFASTFIIDML